VFFVYVVLSFWVLSFVTFYFGLIFLFLSYGVFDYSVVVVGVLVFV